MANWVLSLTVETADGTPVSATMNYEAEDFVEAMTKIEPGVEALLASVQEIEITTFRVDIHKI